MNSRPFASTGRSISEVGLGCWQLGANWGDVSDAEALAILRAAYDSGVTFFDTADVYGDGRSERLIGQFLRETPGAKQRVFVATKLGRRGDPGWPANFSRAGVRRHTDDSLQRLGMDALDLTQLHCIPFAELQRGEVFEHLRELQREGKIRAFGASVETVAEGRFCCGVPGLVSLQFIFNLYRQKAVEELLPLVAAKNLGFIVRLPLASGLLAGKFSKATSFGAADHRNFNRDGQAFNVGETFAGIPFAKGVEITEALRALVPAGVPMAEFAMRWILDFPAVSTVIPGASRPEQAKQNVAAGARPKLSPELHAQLAKFYAEQVAAHIRGPY